MTKIQIKYILIIGIISLLGVGFTKAYFTSEETLGESIITSGTWNNLPNVIINEVMWSGTSRNIEDQWIELRNTTNEDINIGKWKIYYLRDLNKPPIMIPANRVIPANGYFLISNYSNESKNSMLNVESNMSNASINLLPTNNGNLILKDDKGNIIDTVLGEWPAGRNNLSYNSMQRTEDGYDGLDPNSWYTCVDLLCTDTKYWKEESLLNYGSPKDKNIKTATF